MHKFLARNATVAFLAIKDDVNRPHKVILVRLGTSRGSVNHQGRRPFLVSLTKELAAMKSQDRTVNMTCLAFRDNL